MNKIFSRILLSTCVCLALGFTACSDDDDTPVVGPQSAGAYFPSNAPNDYDVELGDTGVTLNILRTNTDAAQTVQLSMSDSSGFFSMPSSVSFAAGENSAQIPISFDSNKFEPKDYQVVITVAEADAYLYGMHEYTFTIGLADSYRWVPYGTCQFNDSFFFDDFFECEIQQHAIDKNSYRLVDPYRTAFDALGIPSSPDQSKYLPFQLLPKGEKYRDVLVTMDDLVGFSDVNTGFHHATYDDDVNILFPGRLTSMAKESYWTYNCVKSYQEDGTPNVVQLAPYYYMFGLGRGWNYTQDNDMIRIVFPGGRLMDASAEVEITSVDIPEDDGDITVKADIAIGADVNEARVAIIEGNDAETGNFLITHDRADYITITSSGEVTLTMPKANAAGIYSVIVSTYVKGKATDYNYDTFTYDPNAGKDWQLIGTGTYTYEQFFQGDDPGLEIYKSVTQPGLYKITDWGYGVDFLFNMDSRNQITVADQFIGYVHSDYGDVYVDDFVNYTEDVSAGISYFDSEDGVFHFNVVYYVTASVFGYGYETFTLDSDKDENDQPAKPARKPAKAKSVKSGLLNMSGPQLRQNGFVLPATLLCNE